MRVGGSPPRQTLQRLRSVYRRVRPPLSLDFKVHRGQQPDKVLHIPGPNSDVHDLHHDSLRGLHEQQFGEDPAPEEELILCLRISIHINLVLNMLCCEGCNLETETTLTAVLFVDQLASQRANILTKYAQKHLKNIATNHDKYSHQKTSRDNKEN